MRTNILIITCLFLLGLSGCRDAILHEIGVEKVNNTNSATSNGTWQKVANTPDLVKCLEVYNNIMWVGGEFENAALGYEMIARFDGTAFSNAFGGDFLYGGIYELDLIDTKLWIGGDYTYWDWPTVHGNLMYIQNNYFYGVNFDEGCCRQINDVEKVDNQILVAGRFTNSQSDIQTNHLERIVGLNAIGYPTTGVLDELDAIKEFDGDLYAVGDNEITSGVNMLAKWDGITWSDDGVTKPTAWSNYGHSLEVFKGDLYWSGKMNYGTSSMKKKSNGVWSDISPINIVGTVKSKLVVTNNKLCLVGGGIGFNGSYTSNVLELNGTTWGQVGQMTLNVNDIEFFNGELYCATDDGLYILN